MTTGPPRRISRVAAHWRAGRSTRWPKCTRLGIYLDVAFFLTALAQFGLGIAITHSLNRIPNTFQCRHDSSGPTGSFELVEAKRPLTFTGWNQAKGSLQEMQSNGVMLLSLGDSLSRLYVHMHSLPPLRLQNLLSPRRTDITNLANKINQAS
jgi:hypothetical protein